MQTKGYKRNGFSLDKSRYGCCGLIGGVEWSERGFWCFLMEIKSWLYGILI